VLDTGGLPQLRGSQGSEGPSRLPDRSALQHLRCQLSGEGSDGVVVGVTDRLFQEQGPQLERGRGDAVLSELARRLQRVCRAEDLLARYGGEEFALILRQTDAPAALVFGERLRGAIGSRPFDLPSGNVIPVTISVGVATRTGKQLRGAELLDAADTALRRAKAAGRDRVQD